MKSCFHSVKNLVLFSILALAPTLIVQGQTLAPASTANDYAYIYSSGSSFTTGLLSGAAIPTGNINTLQTQVRSFVKFDLAPFQGLTISKALLSVSTYSISGATHNIGVNVVGYNASGVAFTNSPSILSYPLTSGGTFTVTSAGNYNIDITSAIQSAINAGYAYVTIRLNDNTADGGGTAPYYVMFNSTVTLNLTPGANQTALISTSNDIAWDYSGGGVFTNGPFSGTIPTGNINTSPTQVRSFIKFPISAFQGTVPSSVMLNLTTYSVSGTTSQYIGVNLVNYDAGSGAFSNSPPLIGRSITSVGQFSVDHVTTSYSFDVTSAIKTAISNGYSYVTLRLNNNTADGIGTAPFTCYTLFNTNPTLSWRQGGASTYQTIYVDAVNGSDSNPGISPQEAYQTVGKAQTYVRTITSAMTGNIEVEMAEGTYFAPTGGFAFTQSDSGKNGWRVIWRNAPGQDVLWSAGQPLSTTWTQQGSTKVYKSATNPTWNFRQMYVNNVQVLPAHTTWVTTDAFVNATTTGAGGYIEISTSNMPAFTAGQPLEINMITSWTNVIMRIGSTSATGGKTRLYPAAGYTDQLQTQQYFHLGTTKQTYVFQYSKAFQGTNEDFYATATDGIYFTQPTGVNISTAAVVIPQQTHVLTVTGAAGNTVTNLAFYGISFAHTNWNIPTAQSGFVGQQADFYFENAGAGLVSNYIPGGVAVTHATAVDFERCSFQNMGGSGLELTQDVTGARIVGNNFWNIAGTALMIMPNPNPNPPNITGCVISDNLIQDCGTVYWGGIGISDFYSQNDNIIWNDIEDVSYSGITAGWGFGAIVSPTNPDQGIYISNNYITNALETCIDGGGIYMNGPLGNSTAGSGTIYRNYVTDITTNPIGGPGGPAQGIYLDIGSNYVSITNNAIQNINGTNPSVFVLGTPLPNIVDTPNNSGITLVEANAGARPGFTNSFPPLPFTSVRNVAAYARVYSSNNFSDDNNQYQTVDMRSLTNWGDSISPPSPTVSFDLGRAHRITRIEVQTRQDGTNTPSTLDNFQILGTVNDPNSGGWVTLATQSGSVPYGGTWVVNPTPPATSLGTTNYRSIQVYKSDGANAVISEVKIYSDN